MSKTNYKRLGDYIREVDVRNRDLKVTKLYGVNLQKEFMPSVANIIGTDLSKYKIVSYNQFGCKLMSVERDHKLPISLMKESQPAIMSSAYFVFEVIDENVLNPDYLFMQIKRPEFDRRLWFSTGGDVRGGATWDNLCDMPIIVPSIDQQRKIVAEYNAIQQRIKLNEQQIVKLEETAQAIYRKMFVDGIDKNNLPEGWRMGTLGEICEINTDNISSKEKIKEIYYLDSSSVINNIFSKYQMLNSSKDEIPSRAKRKVKYNDIVYSTVRPNLKHYGIIKDNIKNLIVSTAFTVIRSCHKFISNELLYLILIDDKNTEYLQGIAEMSKATYPSITPEDIKTLKILIPSKSTYLNNVNKLLKHCFNLIYFKHTENDKLTELQSLLLVKMWQ
ncbi:type I restriction modification DNA specificity domain protein [Prevotella sp. CAG:1185]|nr:type I restriction modification DNA specificity domain protein [Prevotella sp. CAG:1185]